MLLQPLGVTKYRLAKESHIPADRVGKIVQGRRSITADTALRFAQFFGTSAEFWMNLQVRYDLEVAKDRYGQKVAKAVTSLNQEAV